MPDKYDDRKWLFTDDDDDLRGNLASKAFFADDGGESVNEEPDKFINDQAPLFMKVSSYDNRQAGEYDQDVHHEFTDFIVNTALFHRELDKQTELGKEYETLSTRIDSATFEPVLDLINTSVARIASITSADRDNILTSIANKLKNEVFSITMDTELNPFGNFIDTNIKTYIQVEIQGTVDTLFALPHDTTRDAAYADYKKSNLSSFITQLRGTLKRLAHTAKNQTMSPQPTYTTLATNPHAKKVYEKVYANWGELSDSTKSFYTNFLMLMKRSGSGGLWDPVPESQYGSVPDFNNLRLNLKKGASPKITLFGERLPKYSSKYFRKVWFINNTGAVNAFSTTNANMFRELYNAIYHQDGSAGGVSYSEFASTYSRGVNKYFRVKVDDLVRGRIFAISNAKVEEEVLPETDGPMSYLSMENRNIWFRDSTDPGVFVTVVNGEKVRMGAEDAETMKRMKAAHQCYGTYVNNKDEASCKKFIFECLLSQDPKSLERCLTELKSSDKSFFEVATNDIKNLHPVLAQQLLHQFGFRKTSEYDNQARSQIWKVESCAHWLQHYMAKKFSANDIATMLAAPEQRPLLNYLDLVSQYVNANPAILNAKYTGTSDEAVGLIKPTAHAQKLGLIPRMEVSDKSKLYCDLDKLWGKVKTQESMPHQFFSRVGNNQIFSPFMFNGIMPHGFLSQRGGGDKCDYILKKFNANQVTCGEMISNFMQVVTKELENRGKKLSATETKNLNDHLVLLKQLECEMLRTLCYIDEYSKLVDTLKDYKAETVDMKYISNFVDRLSGITKKKNSVELKFVEWFGDILSLFKGERKKYFEL